MTVRSQAVERFLDVDSLGMAMDLNAFDVEEEVGIVVGMVRDPDPKVAGPALRHLRAMRLDAAKASGLLGQFKQEQTTTDEHGNKTRRIATTTRLLSRMAQENDDDAGSRATHQHFRPLQRRDDDAGEVGPADVGEGGGPDAAGLRDHGAG